VVVIGAQGECPTIFVIALVYGESNSTNYVWVKGGLWNAGCVIILISLQSIVWFVLPYLNELLIF